jgi:polar amino acid transport system permease protein
MTWNGTFAWEILPQLLRGLWVTLQAVAGGMTLALLLGLVWAVARRSRHAGWRIPVTALLEFVRGTPLLIQLYVVYYVLPNFGIVLSPWTAGLLALGVHYSSYTAEVYRAGMEGVDAGQWRAARALNLTPWQTYRHVIFPQAIPPILPALGNYLIAMFKDTPLLSAITVLEILQQAKILGNEHFRYLEPFTLVGLFYLAVSLAAGRAVAWCERRLASAPAG